CGTMEFSPTGQLHRMGRFMNQGLQPVGNNGMTGRQAAWQFQQSMDPNQPIQYTQPDANGMHSIDDAFGYAEEDILFYSPDLTMNGQEIAQVFGGNTQIANSFLKAADLDNNGTIDGAENAAILLFYDNPLNSTLATIFGLMG